MDVQCLVSCLDELATALSTIFLTRLVSSNVNAIVVASFQAESRMKQEMAVRRTDTYRNPFSQFGICTPSLEPCTNQVCTIGNYVTRLEWSRACVHVALLSCFSLRFAPFRLSYGVMRMQGVSPGCVLTPAEREFSMEPYDTVMSTFTQYADLAVQFGYATLFAGG